MKADGSDAKIATHKGKNIMDLIQSRRKSIEEALPRNIDVDRFTRICLVNVAGNRRLLECEPVTLLTAVMQCAQLGLEPGGPLGMAHLIPFKKRVQLILGYRGLVELLYKTGRFTKVVAQNVKEKDYFEYEWGTNEHLIHKPSRVPSDNAFFYSYVKDTQGEITFDVMTLEEVERIRDNYSKSYQEYGEKSVWGTDFVEMGKKTVLRRLCKMLQLSAQDQRNIMQDESVKTTIKADMSTVPNEEGLDFSLEDAGLSEDTMKGVDGQFEAEKKEEKGKKTPPKKKTDEPAPEKTDGAWLNEELDPDKPEKELDIF